ncbi:MAG TPA: peptidoglycan bridge formation glycyltransferase FemA/FemB family protein [Candidatus Limnocylindrales bacterium]|nr:peptidoglycan bridge formation glycyltransferase FemA/FemB family protein [Candidatus Limnocylindrales bacterium]
MTAPAPAPRPEAAPVHGRPDPATWDATVEANPLGSYLQLTSWARVKAVNGWRSRRMLDGDGDAAVGAQVLLRRPGPLPWSFAYAPRGPVLGTWDAAAIDRFTELARERLRGAGRPSHLRIDPEVERGAGRDEGGIVTAALAARGWRPSPPIQPVSTRAIDLTADEDALWGDLRKKWRQYVNKARTGGVRVVDAGPERLDEFYEIYRETADRAGFLIRAKSAYQDIWRAYAPAGRARLLFAELPDGTPAATLFLVRAGTRVVEPYGGMTQAGGDSRANYLLKWEAIRSSREQGATTYDLWGLAHPGIAHFKTGFGGREIHYIGAWDLVLDPLGRRTYQVAQAARVRFERLRHGLNGASAASASGYAGDGGDAGADA